MHIKIIIENRRIILRFLKVHIDIVLEMFLCEFRDDVGFSALPYACEFAMLKIIRKQVFLFLLPRYVNIVQRC